VKKNTKSLVPLLLILVSSVRVEAAAGPQDIPKEMLTLTTAVEYALDANPEVLKAREQIKEFDQLIRQARSEALPRVDAVVGVNQTRDPGLRNSPFFSRIIGGGEIPPEALAAFKFNNFIWQFDVQQPIYTFGRVSNALRAAHDEVDGVHLDVREVENRLSRDVARACYGYLLAKQRLVVLRSEQAARERQLEYVQARFDLEDATRLDLLQAQVTLNNLRPGILAAENDLQIAVAVVNDALGRPVDAPFDITLPLVLPESFPEIDEPRDLMAVADENRPELLRFQIDRKVLDSRVGITRSNVLPEVNATFSFGINTFNFDNLRDWSLHTWTAGVRLNWTLFDGLQTNAEIKALRSQVSQNLFDEGSFRSELAMELERTTGTWTRALEAVEVAQFAVEQAQEAQRVAEESFQYGAATTLDLLEAARALREAEFSLAQAAHEALVALAEIKYLVGFRADAPNSALELGGSN
jgi:HAE1 family hydrophobic/amphiphilic exporter-1